MRKKGRERAMSEGRTPIKILGKNKNYIRSDYGQTVLTGETKTERKKEKLTVNADFSGKERSRA